MVYTVCIGSNEEQRRNLELARLSLRQLFPDIRFSHEVDTQPVDISRQALFANQLARFTSPLTAPQVISLLKQTERKAGRRPEEKPLGIVRLDIDLLTGDDQVYRPADMERTFVKQGLKELE